MALDIGFVKRQHVFRERSVGKFLLNGVPLVPFGRAPESGYVIEPKFVKFGDGGVLPMVVPHHIGSSCCGDAVDARRVASPGKAEFVTGVTGASLDGGTGLLMVLFVVMFLVVLFVVVRLIVGVGSHGDQRDGEQSSEG